MSGLSAGRLRWGKSPFSRIAVSYFTPSAATDSVRVGTFIFYSDAGIQQGSRIEVTMILPPEMTGGETQWVCCQAKVVRVEKPAGAQYRIAAPVERLEWCDLPISPPYPLRIREDAHDGVLSPRILRLVGTWGQKKS